MGSIYPKEKVPIEEFAKDPQNYEKGFYIQCKSCREYFRKAAVRRTTLLKEKVSKARVSLLTEVHCCGSHIHDHFGVSKYERNKVPKHLFRKATDNPKSDLYEQCSDCRNHHSNILNKWRNIGRNEAFEFGLKICCDCNKIITENNVAFNRNGVLSSKCLQCKKISNERSRGLTNIRYKILLELLEKHECSCYKCKCIYFKPQENSLIIERHETYSKNDGKRYLLFSGTEFSVQYIIKYARDDLELSIIDLDHLTEHEQRERGILKADEPFVPKSYIVSRMRSESLMRLESLKCQHLCARCHVEETIRREKGTEKFGVAKEKADYSNKIKLNGCTSCGYKNPELLRFLEHDHLDQSTKIASISQMIANPQFSLNDVTLECSKCRVLCRFCHRIHSRNQRKYM